MPATDVGGEREEGALPGRRREPAGRVREQSDDAQLALKTFIAVDPDSRRDWFESENSKNYPAYAGH